MYSLRVRSVDAAPSQANSSRPLAAEPEDWERLLHSLIRVPALGLPPDRKRRPLMNQQAGPYAR
jgi:hypothetical protein